jgi:hypothetical protein
MDRGPNSEDLRPETTENQLATKDQTQTGWGLTASSLCLSRKETSHLLLRNLRPETKFNKSNCQIERDVNESMNFTQ